MARVPQLSVWMDEKKIAVLRRTGPGRVTCEYTRETVDDQLPGIPMLSCSLPVRPGRRAASPFVTGLLPEGHHRTSMAQLAGVDTLDALGMLARFGRDVAGALVIAPETHGSSPAATPNGDSLGRPDRHPGLVELSEAAGL